MLQPGCEAEVKELREEWPSSTPSSRWSVTVNIFANMMI